jgi:2-polyprenyl-6-methoxyphenol hydroxylase-like FAD-dependent oxidoreductase
VRHEDKTEVLVVGAGPVGMLTAIALAESGVRVKIIDQESRPAAHSYACALHPATLRLLDRWGLATEILKRGRQLDTVAFYDGDSRRAEIRYAKLSSGFPYAVVLPQSELEQLLEQQLRTNGAVEILWNHRLNWLKCEKDAVVATIDEFAQSAKGYSVPAMDWEIVRTMTTRAEFVVGADGHNSHVRQCLDIPFENVGEPELFAVYEFESEMALGNELKVVLTEKTTDALWPLPEARGRWSFQLAQPELFTEFPSKERQDVLVVNPAVDLFTKQDVEKFVRARAPWFQSPVEELEWCTDVRFERRLVRRFGRNRCWLAGDAAHQTGPVGMQSMNVGLQEASQLADSLQRMLRKGEPHRLLEDYEQSRRKEWSELLGLNGRVASAHGTDRWISQRSARMLPCIPASGRDLKCLLNQLGLELAY